MRRNASIFGGLPTSACTLGTAGSDGPDQITSNTYDADNRLTQVTAGYGTALAATAEAVTYSPNGNVLTAVDAKGNLTTSTYDGFDRLSKVQYPTPSNGSVSSSKDYEAFGYDADSHLTSDRRRDGVTITAALDNLGRTSSISSPSTSYLYDNLGRLTSATRNGQTLTYMNDALSRVTSETGPNGAISAQYDLAGRLTRITWPDGYYVTYVNDWAGDVTQIEENGATSGAGLLASYGYNNLGERTSVTRGDNVTTTYGYDAAWRLSSLAHAFPTTSNNQTITLSHSPASQISSRTSANATYNWGGTVALSRAYTANGQNQLTQSGGYTLSYDGRGNLSSDSVNSYTYDEANNLTAFNSSATMATDALGRLATVTDLSGGAAQTGSRAFRYFGAALVAEYGTTGSAAGVLEERYVPGPGTDEPIVSYRGASTATRYWLLADERGSVITTADGNGNVVGTNTYDDYGLPASGNTGRFQYTGQIWIPEAGLYHYKARDYSPTLGRFLQTDPIGYGDGMNWYAYAHNDPINWSDPSGTDGCRGCFPDANIYVRADGGYEYQANGGTYYFPDGGNAANPNLSNTSTGEGYFVPDFDTSSYFQANSTPSYAPTPPPANPWGNGFKALQQAAQDAQNNKNVKCLLESAGDNWQGLALDSAGWVANAALPEGSVAAAVVGSTLGVAGIASAVASNDGPVDGVVSGSLAYAGKQTAVASAILRGPGAALAGRIGFYALAASTAYDVGKTALKYQGCINRSGGN